MGIHMSKKSKGKVNVHEKEQIDRQYRTLSEVVLKHTDYPRPSSHHTGSESSPGKEITKMQHRENNDIYCSSKIVVPTDKHLFEEFIDVSENKTNLDLRWSKGKQITSRDQIMGNTTNYLREDGTRYGLKSVISMQRRKRDGINVQQTVHSLTGQQCALLHGTVSESQNGNYKQAIVASKSDPKFRPWTANGKKIIFHSSTDTEKDISCKCLEKKQDIYSSTGTNVFFLTKDGGTLECASCLVPATDTLRSEQSIEPRKVKNISYKHRKHIESISKEKEMYESGETKKHQSKRSSFTPHGGYKMNIKVIPPSDIMDIYLPGHVFGHMEPN
ncbi:hypothetical protein ACJMK2_011148 [Sinanodonta woodiana]|uniref:Uncharacterized protein n=1 Tax=Sinanodonta woodiana TaxID=1069815 RepID=A0ABD3V4K9_SINWO